MAPSQAPAWERIDRYENGEGSDSELDDSSQTQQKARDKASKRFVKRLERSSSDLNGEEAESGIKIEWSGDENDGAAAYKAFKDRKSKKRGLSTTANGPAKKGAKSATSVHKKTVGSKRNKDRIYGDETSEEEDDDTIEQNLPDYLKRYRRDFNKQKEDYGDAGLKVPPAYDDVDLADDEHLRTLQEKPQITYIKPVAPYKDIPLNTSAGIIPAPIAQWLKPYQVEGTIFLHELFVYQKGGILGDDMGLGKTIQVIAALTAAFGKSANELDARRMRKMRGRGNSRWYPKILIICPGSLIANWKSELDKWGWWSVYTYHGNVSDKEAAMSAAKHGMLEIMITTYKTYTMNKDDIKQVRWDCCVADECHTIKERKSEVTQAMGVVNALCRVGLTGTAIQNRYEELWTLLNWTNPGAFGPMSTWKSAICEPLKLGQSHEATAAQLSKARKTAKKLVNNLLPQFFLRRMKSLIADQLPKKTDRVVFCPLTEDQAEAYENFIESDMCTYIRTSTEMCDCGSGKKRGWCCYMKLPDSNEKWQNYVFPCMNILRNLASHIGLLIPSGSDPDRLTKDLDYLQIACPDNWRKLYSERESVVMLSNSAFCGKWRVLSKLLAFWHSNGDKVLVFSHSVRLLKLLQYLFQRTQYNVSYLDGSMSYEARAQEVDRFNTDDAQFVFLISTRAGGVGLNITSANKVVVVDPNWNPSYDLQAQDRAYRIGQTRDVEVFRLVSSGTIEEIVYARQIYKQQQANIGYTASLERRYFKGVQENKDKKGEIFGLQNLFSFQGDNIVLRDIVNKTNVAESRAGVNVVGLDMESQEEDLDGDPNFLQAKREEKEDEAMSQLAALIASGDTEADPADVLSQGVEKRSKAKSTAKAQPKHKTNPIQGILAGAGVEYTHENSEVVGSSKVEARLSKRAEEAGANDDAAVFAPSQGSRPATRDGPVAGAGGTSVYGQVNGNGVDGGADEDMDDDLDLDAGFSAELDDSFGAAVPPQKKPPPMRKDVAYRYHPSADIRQRHFCTMAATFGYDDPVEFALVCEGWTQAQRRLCLERFYEKLRRGEVEVAVDGA